jgi:hypothetical protein
VVREKPSDCLEREKNNLPLETLAKQPGSGNLFFSVPYLILFGTGFLARQNIFWL